MFQIGEFSKIGRVTTRQLRHYDQLDLLKPMRIDPETGYRYYSATQLPQLNRILALKELGLALDQIARLLAEDVSVDEIRGMLAMKKAQIEQTLREELIQVRDIEDRIQQIDTEGALRDYDVVLKSIPAKKILSLRQTVPSFRDGLALMYELHRLLPMRDGRSLLGNFALVFHADSFEAENIDVEMGFLLAHEVIDTLSLADGRQLHINTLPAVETMATVVRVGLSIGNVGCFAALGTWMERNRYEMAGPGREVFIQPFQPGKEAEAVVEAQFAVRKATSDTLSLP